MGKYISTGNRTAAPIFPKMPNVEQRTQAESRPRTDPKKTEEKVQRKPAEKVNARGAIVKKDAKPKEKGITAAELRQGFKMSIILGEPVSRKYRYGRKITK